MNASSENTGVCESEYELHKLVSVWCVNLGQMPLLFRNMRQYFTVACENWGCPSVSKNYNTNTRKSIA